MNWQSLDHFLAMGGYALYVWGSYALVLALVLLEPLLAARRHRRALEQAGPQDGEP
jgi:heme exporter protein D